MRVIAGQAKGRRLKVPQGQDIRPVTNMIKEAVFNVIGPFFDGQTFLDLFAGSGAMGIEALSRGASSSVFVEMDPRAVKIIHENLLHCQLEFRGRIIKGDVFKVLNRLLRQQEEFDFVYVDPPFRRTEYFSNIPEALGQLLTKDGLLIIRSPRNIQIPDKAEGLVRFRTNQYGESFLNYFRLVD